MEFPPQATLLAKGGERMREQDPGRTKPGSKEPSLAPGLEMDELDRAATEEELERGDYTEVTRLFLDRLTDDGER
jgi:hypothetical protein